MKEYLSPCKVNYTLAITNPRADGFHDLVSLVAPIKFYDSIKIAISEDKKDSMSCNMAGVPCDESNLIMKAAQLFRDKTNIDVFFNFELIKKVPHGAGLGGGSSNGAVALKAINELCDCPLSMQEMVEIASQLGSDCPLFLWDEAVIMRGRGEIIETLSSEQTQMLSSLELLVFKPDFSINTGQAYKKMREDASFYISKEEVEARLNKWKENPSIETLPLYNNMQNVACLKYPAIEVILEKLQKSYNLKCLMSGSGSACFAIINGIDSDTLKSVKDMIKANLGESCLIMEAK